MENGTVTVCCLLIYLESLTFSRNLTPWGPIVWKCFQTPTKISKSHCGFYPLITGHLLTLAALRACITGGTAKLAGPIKSITWVYMAAMTGFWAPRAIEASGAFWQKAVQHIAKEIYKHRIKRKRKTKTWLAVLL